MTGIPMILAFLVAIVIMIIAMAAGAICAIIQLKVAGKMAEFYDITNETLKTVGPILFVTAAGGVLGKVIAASDVVVFITSHADVLSTLGIFFPFILAAILEIFLLSLFLH